MSMTEPGCVVARARTPPFLLCRVLIDEVVSPVLGCSLSCSESQKRRGQEYDRLRTARRDEGQVQRRERQEITRPGERNDEEMKRDKREREPGEMNYETQEKRDQRQGEEDKYKSEEEDAIVRRRGEPRGDGRNGESVYGQGHGRPAPAPRFSPWRSATADVLDTSAAQSMTSYEWPERPGRGGRRRRRDRSRRPRRAMTAWQSPRRAIGRGPSQTRCLLCPEFACHARDRRWREGEG